MAGDGAGCAVKVEYISNNSGGRWWLKDDQWKALEAAGWVVEWFANQEPRTFFGPDENGRWLGALAKSAILECETPTDAIRSFEAATGLDASAEGCNCCGPPHAFHWESGYVSGDDVLTAIHGERARLSKRELLERGQ